MGFQSLAELDMTLFSSEYTAWS